MSLKYQTKTLLITFLSSIKEAVNLSRISFCAFSGTLKQSLVVNV
jgi:hypothetical protein